MITIIDSRKKEGTPTYTAIELDNNSWLKEKYTHIAFFIPGPGWYMVGYDVGKLYAIEWDTLWISNGFSREMRSIQELFSEGLNRYVAYEVYGFEGICEMLDFIRSHPHGASERTS